MKKMDFRGVGVALVTPFNEDYSIDFQGFTQLLKHTYAEGKGVDYWVVQGTTGESATLGKDEKKQILQFVIEHNQAQIPVVYGIGGNHTQEILTTIQKTDFAGIDALLSVSPYYNKPSQNGIYEHFRAIADASPVPIILYNVPGRTASNMKAETTLRLAEHPNIIATKEASGDLVQCMEIAKHKPQDFLLLSGDDLLTNSMIAIGAQGVISVLANAFPEIFRKMTHSALQNRFAEANQALYKLLEINPLMYEESNPVGIKQVLQYQGICGNQVRLPLLRASEALQAKIQNAMPSELVLYED
ncbi:MAG: 4-hydroxy-tetrahydrodipicolinate synthase [Microscillaceae bacterium]|jgi:4-hydroxy-tetrahydrodipicolinate synthase|nr:4-hydroxy-tetrahydrodipicolinate synthase [Microscillaceae bacterium]